MEQASWAAAGMLSGHDPEHPPELTELAELSLSLYPEYLARIEQLAGRRVPLRTLEALISCDGGEGALSGEEAQRRVPGLATEGRRFCLRPEASLDPRDLCASLPLAVAAAGVVLHERAEVLGVHSLGDSVEVATAEERFSAGSFIDCCGAWATGVEPWKGQIFSVQLEPPADLGYVLRSPEIYLVPRGRGFDRDWGLGGKSRVRPPCGSFHRGAVARAGG